jgi:hypothetical protein
MPRKSPVLKVVQPATVGPPTPPSHLGEPGRKLWVSLVSEYRIEDAGGLALLATAAEATDRIWRCREAIDRDGELIQTRYGPKMHPLLPAERDARAALTRALYRLNLDVEPLKSLGGQPKY